MSNNQEVTPEFQELYEVIDRQTIILANEILNHVGKNDIRLLKKIRNRLETTITEIKELN